MTKGKKRIMRDFEIGEISAVDMPAQQGAQMKIIKRADGEDNMFDSEALAKRYIDPSDGAISFATVLGEELKCQEYHEVMEQVCPIIYAMETSLKSIAGDSSIPQETKLTMMRNSVEDFMTVIRRMWSNADTVMMSAFGKLDEEEEKMTKKVSELEAQIAELTKQLEAAKNSPEGEKAAEVAKELETLKAQVTNLTEKLAEETAKASMSDAEKEYMRSLGKEEQMRFRGMSAADRKKQMAKSDDDDETLTLKGKTIRKSAVGDEMFVFMKAQKEENEALAKSAADEREKRENAEYLKAAEEQYKHLPGTPAEKAAALKGIDSLDDKVQESLVKMLTAGEGAIKSAFSTIGSKHSDLGQHSGLRKSTEQHPFITKVNEIAKRDSCSRTVAMGKARKEAPKEYADYNQSEGN